MKQHAVRMLSALLAAVMLSLTIAAAGPEDPGITAFTISSGLESTAATRTSDETAVSRLRTLLAAATEAQLPAAGAEEIARIQTEPATDSDGYVVSRADSSLYLSTGSSHWSLDESGFYSTADLTPGFYALRGIPTATVSSGGSAQTVPAQSSTYMYRRLDNIWYEPQIQQTAAVPVITLSTGQALPPLSFSVTPSSVQVTVTQNGATVFSSTQVEAAAYIPQGACRVTAVATFEGSAVGGNATYVYDIGAAATTAAQNNIRFSVTGSSTYPGEAVVLRATGAPDGAPIQVSTDLDFSPTFFRQANGDCVALLPVSYFTAVGGHTVTLSCNGVEQSFQITANNKQFQVQQLTVSESTTAQTIASQKANEEFNSTILPLRSINDAQQRWEGRFILPVQGARVTTQFGAIRYTNGSSDASRHGGVDLAITTGTTISAPNHGRVLYAGYLQLTGYTIMIEHGYGLKTWYYHMNSVSVQTGDLVEKGQKIGEVGSTGYSTGPHLHYAMSINNVFINPYTAIETDLFDL